MNVSSVLIAGGGMAGFQTASSLRELGYAGDITIVDASTAPPYDRPPLSKDYLLGSSTIEHLAFAKPEWYVEKNIALVLGSAITALDPDSGTVTLANGRDLCADVVVLALGGAARKLPLDTGTASNIHTLRTVEDANALHAAISVGTRLLIVGAGLIGAETASSAATLGATVTLVDPFEPPLVPVVGLDMARYLHAHHAGSGIRTIQGSLTQLIADDSGDYVAAVLESGERLDIDQILVGIGITPNTQLAVAAGLEVDNGVIVDSNHRTSHPRVFSTGDMARTRTADGELARRNEHWESARLSGTATARGILGLEPDHADSHWFWSDRAGIHLEVAGDMSAAAESVFRGSTQDDSFVLFRVNGSTLVAAASINDSMAVRAARRIIAAGTAVTAADLANPAVNLKKLTRGIAS
ncbi:oxidoreductase [Cryobacterium frigoriphilum]|uniref:Oxidoreductase n=1 Tax=Cryobacterium frigoriphilum TaxID=1259150 RepID=A0A4R9A611_9MICO|nr:FAD-dependent oxidoreductase [Cryobacterium frigoriphilum]TFD52284.1 oxidoreductase [Cryobacterium frigoriphilum]